MGSRKGWRQLYDEVSGVWVERGVESESGEVPEVWEQEDSG